MSDNTDDEAIFHSKIGPVRIDYSDGSREALDRVIAEQRAWESVRYPHPEEIRKLRADAARANDYFTELDEPIRAEEADSDPEHKSE